MELFMICGLWRLCTMPTIRDEIAPFVSTIHGQSKKLQICGSLLKLSCARIFFRILQSIFSLLYTICLKVTILNPYAPVLKCPSPQSVRFNCGDVTSTDILAVIEWDKRHEQESSICHSGTLLSDQIAALLQTPYLFAWPRPLTRQVLTAHNRENVKVDSLYSPAITFIG